MGVEALNSSVPTCCPSVHLRGAALSARALSTITTTISMFSIIIDIIIEAYAAERAGAYLAPCAHRRASGRRADTRTITPARQRVSASELPRARRRASTCLRSQRASERASVSQDLHAFDSSHAFLATTTLCRHRGHRFSRKLRPL